MNSKKVSAVIIHWNTPELLEKQLTHLAEIENIEILVVDNASTNTISRKRVQDLFPHVSWIINTHNRGFGFAANQGWRQSQGEWVFFLNPDVQVDEKGVFDLLNCAEKKKLAACGPTQKNERYNRPLPSFASLLIEFTPLGKLIPLSIFQPKTLVGGCLLIQRSALEKIGGWDERFFLWYEDSDLSYQLHKHGLPYGFCPTTSISHVGGASFTQIADKLKRQIFFLSLRAYAQKNLTAFAAKVLSQVTHRFAKNILLPVDPEIKASIVVPNIHIELLRNFLAQNDQSFTSEHELIIVTSSPEWLTLKEKYPEAIFIYQAHNTGFASTVNLGFQRARGKYLGTVNDDTILPKDWLSTMISVADDIGTELGSLSPIVLHPNTQVESAGINVLPYGKAQVLTEVSNSGTSDTFNAACVLLSRSALEKVGLFDESFGSYLEDIDLGLRIGRAGWKNFTTAEVKITHLGQQTSQKMSKKKAWLDYQNWWKVIHKNFPLGHRLQYLGPILLERSRNFSGWLKAK
jgi:GT2 family glycosyltransferase